MTSLFLAGVSIGMIISYVIMRLMERKGQSKTKKKVNIGDVYRVSHDPYIDHKAEVLKLRMGSDGKRYVKYKVSWTDKYGDKASYTDSKSEECFINAYGDKKVTDA